MITRCAEIGKLRHTRQGADLASKMLHEVVSEPLGLCRLPVVLSKTHSLHGHRVSAVCRAKTEAATQKWAI